MVFILLFSFYGHHLFSSPSPKNVFIVLGWDKLTSLHLFFFPPFVPQCFFCRRRTGGQNEVKCRSFPFQSPCLNGGNEISSPLGISLSLAQILVFVTFAPQNEETLLKSPALKMSINKAIKEGGIGNKKALFFFGMW